MRLPLRPSATIAVLLGLAVTATAAAVPFVHLAYRSRQLHVTIETAATLIALLTAFLVLGRFLRSRALGDLLLVGGLATLSVTNLAFALVPATVAGSSRSALATWAPLAGRLVGTCLIAAAALVGPRRIEEPRRALATLLGSLVALLAGVGVGIALASPVLPLSDENPDGLLQGHPALLAAQAIGIAAFAAAALGFRRRAAAESDVLLGWLSIAAILGATASVNYLLFPTLYSDWVYLGDVFRLGFYVLMLTGAASEIRGYWLRLAATAVVEERRRLARDVHDGLAQELAFLVRHGDDRDVPRSELVSAAMRALDESRRAIAALVQPTDQPLELAVAHAAEEVALRLQGRVHLELAPALEATPKIRDALSRIVREAVANALRHGGTGLARVTLAGGAGIVLRVEDDGRGFDPRRGPTAGFGLTSMRERVEALGGRLEIRSAPGRGTRVEAVIP